MKIKNLNIFTLENAFALGEQLTREFSGEAFDRHRCPPCGEQEIRVSGFCPPISDDSEFNIVAGDRFCALMHKEIRRQVPAATLAEEVRKRVAAVEGEENRKLSRREKADIRDEASFNLLPRAFPKTKKTLCVVDWRRDQLWVATRSRKYAESVVADIRNAVGSLPVSTLEAAASLSPRAEMTAWVSTGNTDPLGFECGDRCVLESEDETIRSTGVDVHSDEIKAHVTRGMQVTRLNLAYDESIEFDLTESLDLLRIRPLGRLRDDFDAIDADDAAEEFESTLTLEVEELRHVLSALMDHFETDEI